MPKLNYNGNRLPKLCNDRGRAYAWHNGKRVYFGVSGTPDAKEKYRQFKIDLLRDPTDPAPVRKVGANPVNTVPITNPPPDAGTGSMLVAKLAVEFLKYHIPRLHKTDVEHFNTAIAFLVELYGSLSVDEISPKKIRTVRSQMIQSGRFCRRTINMYITKLVRIFVWGCEEEWVSSSVAGALKMIKNLPKGDPDTFDHPEREDVPDDVIRRTLAGCYPTIAAMIQVQYLLGLRPSELCRMTVGGIKRTKDAELWYYDLEHHKTKRFIGKKVLPLGKAVQKLLEPFLIGKLAGQAVFSPRQAIQEYKDRRWKAGKTPMTPARAERDRQRAENPTDRISEFYDRDTYRQAVEYAIKRVNKGLPEGEKPIPKWTPYRLRNSAATIIELNSGLDAAQAQLGHKSADMTRRYSKAQLRKREQLAREQVNPFADDWQG
jgi:integrase